MNHGKPKQVIRLMDIENDYFLVSFHARSDYLQALAGRCPLDYLWPLLNSSNNGPQSFPCLFRIRQKLWYGSNYPELSVTPLSHGSIDIGG
ncbi:hypothetical protein V6N11_009419 [Hibiscus sabdariffa]|uniref:Uncharacterized protein n=1 Tax=Hibiscus sabdariffa TaxID=183260 RepID=A0ABR2NSQ3_9ROSI